MERQLPDFLDSIEWNLVGRIGLQAEQLDARSYRPIPAQSYFIQNSDVLIIGIKSATAQPTWNTGGWASQIIPFVPSSTTSFTAAVQNQQKRLRLNLLNLVIFPKITDSWILEIATPHWFLSTFIEVWRYDGRDVSQFDRFDQVSTDLIRIEQKIDAPS